jgi:hypothetical protein
MSTCTKCRADVVWVPKPSGQGYFRPLELVQIEDAGALYVLSGANLLQVNDTLLQWHVCEQDRAPRPVLVLDDPEEDEASSAPRQQRPLTGAEEIELARVRAEEELELRRQEAAAAENERWRQACLDEIQKPYIEVECPRCGAPEREPCHSLSMHLVKNGIKRATSHSHPERQALYWGKVGFGPEHLEDPDPRRHYAEQRSGVARVLYPWHSRPDEKAMRNWLHDNVDLLTDLGEPDAHPAD